MVIMGKSEESVLVVVRCRPLSSKEVNQELESGSAAKEDKDEDKHRGNGGFYSGEHFFRQITKCSFKFLPFNEFFFSTIIILLPVLVKHFFLSNHMNIGETGTFTVVNRIHSTKDAMII